MNQTERDLIARLFERIRGVEGANRDPEAEAYITENVARQPHAPYAMAQTVVVQDKALEAAHARIEELERELEAARSESDGPSPWGPRAQDAMGRPMSSRDDSFSRPAGSGYAQSSSAPREPMGGQPGYGSGLAYGSPPQPAPQADSSRGGGFLSGALQTAAGVAAGALLFQGARSLFGSGEERGGDEASRVAGAESAGGSQMSEISDQFSGWFGGGDRNESQAAQSDDDAPLDDGDADDDRWI